MSLKKRNTIISLSILLVATLVIGATYAYFTYYAPATKNVFVVGNFDFEDPPIEEEFTPPGKEDTLPGNTLTKAPTFTSKAGNVDVYLRMIVTITGNNGGVASAEQIATILETIYYDTEYVKGEPNLGNLKENAKYSTGVPNPLAGTGNLKALLDDEEIYKCTNLNPLFTLDAARSDVEAGILVYNYTPILSGGTTTTPLFTNIVYPADWDTTRLELLLGEQYEINVSAHVIQASSFANSTEAFAALDEQGAIELQTWPWLP